MNVLDIWEFELNDKKKKKLRVRLGVLSVQRTMIYKKENEMFFKHTQS